MEFVLVSRGSGIENISFYPLNAHAHISLTGLFVDIVIKEVGNCSLLSGIRMSSYHFQ